MVHTSAMRRNLENGAHPQTTLSIAHSLLFPSIIIFPYEVIRWMSLSEIDEGFIWQKKKIESGIISES
jgi:hypothetical protein